MTTTAEFSRIVDASSIDEAELSTAVEANADERARLAKRFDLVGIDALAAEVALEPEEGGRLIRLSGTLRADVIQTCVVTLEPIAAHLEVPIERHYTMAPAPTGETVHESEYLDLESQEPPDFAPDGRIDVGEAVAEELALNLDPFPRKPGISFQDYAVGPDAEQPVSKDEKAQDSAAEGGAFAALAKLRDKLK